MNNKVFFRTERGIIVIDFSLIDSYAIVATKVGFSINVKLREQPIQSYCISSIISTFCNSGNGILYEIKNVCLELNKNYHFSLPSWITNVYY